MSKRIKLTNFKPDDKNFNLHSERGMSLLQKSVEKVGVIESITVSADDKVISGNARQEVMVEKFPDAEPIIIETDGTRPVILKRTDIKSDTKEFHTAALLANTVAKHNINLDEAMIQEVAVEEYDIKIEELGVAWQDVTGRGGGDGEKNNEGYKAPGDAFNDAGVRYKEQYGVIVICINEREQEKVFKELQGRGFDVKIVVT